MVPGRVAIQLLAQAMIVASSFAAQNSSNIHQKSLVSYQNHIIEAVRLTRQGNQYLLISESKKQSNPIYRIIYAYGLLKLNTIINATIFIDSFPKTPCRDLDLLEIDKAFPNKDDAPKFPGDRYRFSYWRITEALISLAKRGDAKALQIWLSFASGWGSAEYTEGNLEDLAYLFNEAPAAVVQNWERFSKRTSEIYANEEEPKHFHLLRKSYLQYLPVGLPHRKEILALIDRLETDAKLQKESSRQAWNKFIEKQNSSAPQSP